MTQKSSSLGLVIVLLGCVLVLPLASRAQSPAAGDAEAPLRKRVFEFYTLMKMKKAAEAEKYVTADTLEQFRLMPNGEFMSAEINSIDFAQDKRSAAVMINLLVSSASIPVPFALPRKTNWRLESDGWKIAIPTQTMEQAGAGVMFPGGSKALPPPPKTDLAFANPVLNISPIKQGEKRLAKFPFTNSSNRAVTITDLQSDCKCIVLKSEKKTYKPGEAGEIVVEFDSSAYEYKFGQSLKVITTPGPQEVMLLLTADVSPAH